MTDNNVPDGEVAALAPLQVYAVPMPPPVSAPALRLPAVGARRAAAVVAAVGMIGLLAVPVAAWVPSSALVDKTDCVELTPPDDTGAQSCARFDDPESVQFAVVPASAEPVRPRLVTSGVEDFQPSGDLYFVTVRTPELSMLEWFTIRREGSASVRSFEDLYPDQTPAESREESVQMMRDAKRDAIYVGLLAAGYEPVRVPGDVIIQQILCFARADDGTCTERPPSDDVLDAGDVLTAVDGTPIETVEDLSAVLADRQPGDVVTVEFERTEDGEPTQTLSGDIELIASPDDPERALVGFVPLDTSTIEFPEGVNVQFNTDDIGGPSAGLSFTLALVDRLTPGELTGGANVAVTGTIGIDGSVGPIGGLTSKAKAVQQAGVDYFIVPVAQGEADIAAARAVVGDDVQIIPVATLDEALAALEALGGDPILPSSPRS